MIGPWWRAAAWLALALLSLAAPARATTTIHADGLETMADTGWLTATQVRDTFFVSGPGLTEDVTDRPTTTDGIYDAYRFDSEPFIINPPTFPNFAYSGAIFRAFGASIPANSILTGIEVKVRCATNVGQHDAASGNYPERASTADFRMEVGTTDQTGVRRQRVGLPSIGAFFYPPIKGDLKPPYEDSVGSLADSQFSTIHFGGQHDLLQRAPGAETVTTWPLEQINSAEFGVYIFDKPRAYTFTALYPQNQMWRLWVKSVQIRVHYFPLPAGPGARFFGSATLTAAITRARLLKPATVTGSGTVTAGLKSGTNLASRIHSGPARGRGTLDVVMTKSVGGVRSTYLYPEPKASGTLSATLRKGFSAKPTASGTLSATLRAARNAYPSEKAWVGNGVLSAFLRAQRRIAATALGAGTLAATMTRGARLAPAPAGTGTMTAALIARRPLAAAPAATGTMTAGLYAARPVDIAGTTTMAAGGTMAVLLQKALPIATTMQGGGTVHGDEGRANPDLTNLFWMPSKRYVDADPWSRDVDAGAWDRDVDASA